MGDPRLLVAVCVGGAIGAVLRGALQKLCPIGSDAIWTVLAINVGGAVLLAHLSVRLQERLPPSTYRRPFVGTGFCGAFTTFSTMQLQVVEAGRDGHVARGAAYIAISVTAGIAAVVATTAGTRRARLR